MKTEHWAQPLADDGARSILIHPINFGDSLHHPSLPRHRVRRKRHLAWEQAELASGGLYARNFEEIVRRYPTLSMMECRVCALVKAMLPSWKIAEILGICEDTVENHRVNARRKMCLHGETLVHHLSHL
jgi:DNA-binding CsgD family transcriptional regulator